MGGEGEGMGEAKKVVREALSVVRELEQGLARTQEELRGVLREREENKVRTDRCA